MQLTRSTVSLIRNTFREYVRTHGALVGRDSWKWNDQLYADVKSRALDKGFFITADRDFNKKVLSACSNILMHIRHCLTYVEEDLWSELGPLLEQKRPRLINKGYFYMLPVMATVGSLLSQNTEKRRVEVMSDTSGIVVEKDSLKRDACSFDSFLRSDSASKSAQAALIEILRAKSLFSTIQRLDSIENVTPQMFKEFFDIVVCYPTTPQTSSGRLSRIIIP